MTENKELISEQELIALQDLNKKFNEMYLNIGVIDTQIKDLEYSKKEIYRQYDSLKKKEKELTESLSQKYPGRTISIDTGEVS